MNKRKIKLIISAIVIAVAAVLTGGYFIINSIKSVNDGIKDVSVINLIANPQKYDGEIVRVIGCWNGNLKDMEYICQEMIIIMA